MKCCHGFDGAGGYYEEEELSSFIINLLYKEKLSVKILLAKLIDNLANEEVLSETDIAEMLDYPENFHLGEDDSEE